MNKKQRWALILIILAIILAIMTLFVRAAIDNIGEEVSEGDSFAQGTARVSLEILPPRNVEDKGVESGSG